jgi:hypothetical protein
MPDFIQNDVYPRRVKHKMSEWPLLERSYETYKPLKLLVEGDSWVAYPEVLRTKNITLQLADNDDYNLIILCLAKSGDEAVAMMSSSANKVELLGALQAFEFDALLFSGGGNDIVGQYDFDYLLKTPPNDKEFKIENYIDINRLSRRMNQIKNAYLDLIDYVKTYGKGESKNKMKIITHTYDYLPPSKKGVFSFTDSWLYPHFMAKGITEPKEQIAVINYAIDQFVKTLGTVQETSEGRFELIDTRGTIGSDPGDWLNEIHPKSDGFKKIADKIYQTSLKKLKK